MKNIVFGIAIIFLLLSGCTSEPPSLELISNTVELRDELGPKAYQDETGEKETHSMLEYHFVLKNTGNKTIGGKTVEKGIDIKIIPNEKLKQVSEEVMDKNIYDEIYLQNGVFVGTPISKSTVLNLLPNAEVEYSIGYYLGPSEEHEFRRIPRTQQQLEKIKNYAMNATLVVIVKDKEIARFELGK